MTRGSGGGSLKREIALAAFVVLGLPLLAGVAWMWGRTRLRDREYARVAATLPAELAAARREGIPLEPADLRRNPPVPDAENAAPLFEKVTVIRRTGQHGRALGRGVGIPGRKPTERIDLDIHLMDTARHGRLRSPDLNLARAYLASHAAELRLADEAARLPHCDFPRSHDTAYTPTPEFAPARGLARLLLIRSAVETDEGRPLDALRTVAEIGQLADQIGEEPTLIPYLVQVAIAAIADRAWQRVVFVTGDRADVLAAAKHVSAQLDVPPRLEYHLEGELVSERHALAMIDRSGSTNLAMLDPSLASLESRMRDVGFRKLFLRAEEARIVAYNRSVIAAIRAHPDDPIAQSRSLDVLHAQLEAHAKKPTYELVELLGDVFTGTPFICAKQVESGRLRRVMIALADYHRTHGRYPSSLDVLSRRPEPDIFSGKPPLYRTVPGGFMLYSLGQDLKDNGGVTPDDVVVRWPPKPKP